MWSQESGEESVSGKKRTPGSTTAKRPGTLRHEMCTVCGKNDVIGGRTIYLAG